ncbi:diguanylate cyclase [Actinoplanes sp. NPDC049668]|uniref:GGDEF domain-containing protein n=1 Tax=unclassified Actinoplanes TaxID=2626549 RepID=UPI0033A4FFFA
MTKQAIWLFVAAGVGATIAELILFGEPAADVVYYVAAVPLCCLAWWGALRRRQEGGRLIWAFLALMLSLSVTGDAVQTWQYFNGGAPIAGPSDVLWLGAYPPQIAALILMARRRAPGQLRAAALDALTLTTAASVAAYLFLIEPMFAEGRLTVAETLVPVAYPLSDVTMLAVVLLLLLSPGRRGVPTGLLLSWAGLGLFINLGYSVVFSVVSFEYVDRIAALVLLCNVLITAVILHPDRGELTTPGPPSTKMHRARGIFLGMALMAAPVMTVVRHNLEFRAWLVVLVATAVCSGLVVTRFMQAVREQERAQAQLAFQAWHDPLTGLANRALLNERLHRDGPSVLLYLDLDGFKEVNDMQGHDAGDAVLKAVADRLTQAVRADDVVARIGGDEFAVACPGVTIDDAVALAERILRDVDAPIPFRDTTLTVGVSIGIASHSPGPDGSPALVLRSADEAMYKAKRLGRGRWVLAG